MTAGTGLDPAGVDIGEIEGLEKFAVGPSAGMRDQVDLGEAGRRDVPVLRPDGDVMFEQGAGLGAAIEPAADLAFAGLQATIDRAGADPAQLAFHGGRMGKRRRAQGSHTGSSAWRRVDQG